MENKSVQNMTSTDPSVFQAPATLGLAAFITVFVSFLTYLLHKPSIDKKAPGFVSDTIPFFGAFNFYARPWEWWQTASRKSKTGHFSFWVGKHHVIGVTGEAARKMFMDNHDMDFSSPQVLRPLGPFFMPPVPGIFKPGFHNGRSYFLRRLIELQKTERLVNYLSRMTGDARDTFAALSQRPNGFVNPHEPCWRTVFSQTCRLIFADEIADDSKLLDVYQDVVEIFMVTFSLFNVPWPWLPSPSARRRRNARHNLENLLTPFIEKRMSRGAPRKDDGLQILIDHGDGKDYIIDFYLGGLFIVAANARMLTGQMLNIMATRPDLQQKIYDEINAAAEAHSTNRNKGATLVERLDSFPLQAWESAFPFLQVCYTEAIRMWVAFHMARQNVGKTPVVIPGTDEVISPGSFVCLNTMEVHFNPDLYSEPAKYDPERWLEGHDRSRDQTYGFVGWGVGAHPCPGMRWAKLQQNINLVYALAMYEWTSCDKEGQVDRDAEHQKDLESVEPSAMPQVWAKYRPRNKA
ncbi:cytochrome P450 [Xylariales sp. AK1849]|nr:cytochrome P450 [Xylariales sp. AK1849]